MPTKRVRGIIDPSKQRPDGKIKPQQTLNPKGRPPGRHSVSDMRARILNEIIAVEIGGRKTKIPVVEATFRKMALEALKGKKWAIAAVMREWASLEEKQAKAEEATYVFSDADRQTINEIYTRMKACEPA